MNINFVQRITKLSNFNMIFYNLLFWKNELQKQSDFRNLYPKYAMQCLNVYWTRMWKLSWSYIMKIAESN